MSHACSDCLRRSHLLSHLSPRIAELLGVPGRRVPALLALGDGDLIEASAGRAAGQARQFLEDFDSRAARQELEDAQVIAVCRHAETYPARLLELRDPPAAIFGAGDAGLLPPSWSGPLVTVVGTRRASPYGLEVAYELGRGLAAAGLVVVSGMALGIDAAAHRGALDAGGRALAVLACGPDIAYPRTNRPLFRALRQKGLVISELPPGTAPSRWGFPARNRIMAGLAAMTVVVEAAEPSGSLITATFAADLNREVGAVPGHVTARMAGGSNHLLHDGAHVVRGAEDVLDVLFEAGSLDERPALNRVAGDALDADQARVLEAVEAGAGIDSIAADAGLGAGAVRAALGRLEALGLVARSGLGSYQRTASG